MARSEDSVHVVVVRLWSEPAEDPNTAPEWRGEARHVPSGRTTYFRHFDGVVLAIRKLCEGFGEPAEGHDETLGDHDET